MQSPGPGMQGERRQVTILFCDLVGSTTLSERLELEDYCKLTYGYYRTCCAIIELLGGKVARLVGDGILAYFGYPSACENASESAIRASLGILDAMASLRLETSAPLHVHLGLATGMTVISDMVGQGFDERHAAIGLTPNLAARIQGMAGAGTVLVSEQTRRLAGGLFTYADMGLQQLRGLDNDVRVWRVTGESTLIDRFTAHHPEVFECVGRDVEMGTLLQSWKRAHAGQASIVTIRGEAGIGKSRLLRTAKEQFVRSPGPGLLLQCSPHQASTPLHPLVAWIRGEAGIAGPGLPENLECLAHWLGAPAARLDLLLLAELVGIPVPAAEGIGVIPAERKRALTREILVRHFEGRCERAPVLFMLEDAQWMDGATEEFLRELFRAMRDKRFLALITDRTDKDRNWSDAGATSEIWLQPLQPADAEKLVRNACRGKSLAPAAVQVILERSDGVPLFLEELTASVLESGQAGGEGALPAAAGPLPPPDIPPALWDSLMYRLDRLGDAREVARIASVIGREFSLALLQHVTDEPPARLEAALQQLVNAQLLLRPGSRPGGEYVFKHALIRQAAYVAQLRDVRQALHARIVHAIEAHQPEWAAREPGLMAHHCLEAGLPDKEVDYRRAAGRASTRMVAIPQAVDYYTRAEKVLAGLEPTPANAMRHIQVILELMGVGRFAILPRRLVELGALARSLAARDGVACDADTLTSILFQEGRTLLYSSRYNEARRMFTQIRQIGRDQGSAQIERKPGSALAMNLCCQGLFGECLEFMNEGNIGRFKDPDSPIDYIAGLGWISYALCQVGPGEAGLRCADLSVQEAEQLQSPIYVGGAHVWRSHALMAARRLEEAVAEARICHRTGELNRVPYLGWHGLVFLALCLCRAGRFDEASASLERAGALLAGSAHGQWSLLDYLPAIKAEIACFRGDHAQAIALADEAIGVSQQVGGGFAEAIAWRAKAVSSVRSGADPAFAQALFDRALALHERGGAHAERVFATLTWAHALQLAGHAERARPLALAARDEAGARGFVLSRCEYGAAAML